MLPALGTITHCIVYNALFAEPDYLVQGAFTCMLPALGTRYNIFYFSMPLVAYILSIIDRCFPLFCVQNFLYKRFFANLMAPLIDL